MKKYILIATTILTIGAVSPAYSQASGQIGNAAIAPNAAVPPDVKFGRPNSGSAVASGMPCSNNGAMRQSMVNATDASTAVSDEQMKDIIKAGDKDLAASSCLSGILDQFSIKFLFSFPTFDNIVKKVMDYACKVAENYVDEQMGNVYDKIDSLNSKYSPENLVGGKVGGMLTNSDYGPLKSMGDGFGMMVQREGGFSYGVDQRGYGSFDSTPSSKKREDLVSIHCTSCDNTSKKKSSGSSSGYLSGR